MPWFDRKMSRRVRSTSGRAILAAVLLLGAALMGCEAFFPLDDLTEGDDGEQTAPPSEDAAASTDGSHG